ncbi:MAG TPA: hypothetical protein VIG36_01120, partial [Methylocystis sp.]
MATAPFSLHPPGYSAPIFEKAPHASLANTSPLPVEASRGTAFFYGSSIGHFLEKIQIGASKKSVRATRAKRLLPIFHNSRISAT